MKDMIGAIFKNDLNLITFVEGITFLVAECISLLGNMHRQICLFVALTQSLVHDYLKSYFNDSCTQKLGCDPYNDELQI